MGRQLLRERHYGSGFNEVYFRQEMPQADDLIERAKELYIPTGADWKEQQKKFVFPSGGTLRFRPLESTQDAQKYQGQNLSGATVEEAGNYPLPDPIDRLWGAMRSAKGVKPQLLLTANPGGPGQAWIKERFVDPCPSGNKIINVTLPNGQLHRRVFIPSRVQNNKVLLERDPDYVNRLYLVGSKELVKAWLEGDWNAIEGAFFDDWSMTKHVIEPFEIPAHWMRFRSGDWGSAAPFSVGWWAVASEDYPHGSGVIPRGAMVRYREWYGASAPNKGLKLTAEEVARGIREREEEGEPITYSVMDPAAFAEDGGPSLTDRMRLEGVVWRRADNRRVGVRGAMGGWDQMRARMKGVDGRPMIYCFSTCGASIRTIPALQHDPRRPEDLDTTAEDHAADEWRYGCMSRPWTASLPSPPPVQFNDYAAQEQEASDSWL